MKRILLAATVLACSAAPAQAAELIGEYRGNECGGQGGFSNCYAFPDGTTGQGVGDGSGAGAIFKYNSGGDIDTSTLFPTITGSEFMVSLNRSTNTLSFTYAPAVGDPVINYFAIFQANQTRLFYDAAGITSGSINLSTYFPRNPGYSHITFFGSAGGIGGAVPEPATWALMILGFGFAGAAMRRRNSQQTKMQVTYA